VTGRETDPGSRTRYRFGPLERRGLIAGWRAGQIASVAAGLGVAIVIVRGHPAAPAVLLAVVAVGASGAFAWWPVGGRTGEQWLPVVVRWGASGIGGGRRRRAGVDLAGHCIGADGTPCLVPTSGRRASGPRPGSAVGRERRAVRRGPFGLLRVIGYREESAEHTMGVVHDARAHTYTAAVAVLGQSFALLGAAEKDRRVVSWASLLASFARERSVVHRLQWIASTVPDDGAAVAGHLARRAALRADSAARGSYATVLRVAGAETCRHEVLVALQVRATGPGGRAIRSLGGDDAAACAVLAREVASFCRQLSSADVPVERVLDERGFASVVRRAFEASPESSRRCPPCSVGWPWPLVTEPRWDAVRADGSWHATYWIAEWPRVDVGPEFLAPLLLGSVRRTVAVVMEPLSPSRAVRHAERARTADVSDAELRRRGGFLSTARRAKEAELATRREAELADGHASFRFAGYVTVAASSVEDLAAACDATEQAASQCRLELRRLYGEQERSLACTLPLGRGLG
jgi:hypothetical protein